MELKQKLLAPHIQRWTIVPTTRQQNIAEHSHSVAMLAEALYRELVGPSNVEQEVVFQLYALALWHDMPEVVTGDINSAFKDQLGVGQTDIEQIESSVCPELLRVRAAQKHDWQEAIIKIADQIEAALFLKYWVPDSHWRGDDAKGFVCRKMERLVDLAEKAHPQFDWNGTTARIIDGID